uniref:Uncharacterized protein n=1 Tax=Avena sativa TaxID=4498 RepID=A0ACD5UBI8_AVESA
MASPPMIDMISAIEELSGLTTRELSEMLKESESFVLKSKADDGGPKQVDMEKLVSSLPLHLLAVCLDLGRGSDLTYVLRGMRFLHSLSELATRHTRLEQVLLDNVKLSEQVMDLIFFVLSILSHWKKENHLGASPLIHSSLVATSLHLLTSYFSSQWHELVHILLAHPKVDIFMDVAFDCLHEDTRLLSVRLSTLDSKAFGSPFDSQLNHFICQQCEASLQFLSLLCQQKLFRDRILKNKELCRNGGILSLSLTILKLGVPECLKGSMDIASSISRLKAKILSIVAKSDTSSHMKEDLQPVQQPLPTRANVTSVPDSNMDTLPKVVQNIEESTATPSMKQEGNARDETPRTRVGVNGGLLQNSVGQNLIHLGVARTTSAGYASAGTATSMELPRCKSADHFKSPEPTKEGGLRDDDERQPKRKKRTIMNDGQVNEIENALIDEPEMHKNATSLQTWAEKLSRQGSEITSSQLKNWLNNRKAKLARIAKERGGPYDGENADKPSTPTTCHFGDSSESAGEESYLPPSRMLNDLGISKGNRLVIPDTNDPTTQAEFNLTNRSFTRPFSFEPGRPVLLIDNEGNEIGKGEIFQVEGRAQGKGLVESHICIIDISELKIEKWRELPHPSEASGRTFQEAESMHGGVMRVAWDIARLTPVAP